MQTQLKYILLFLVGTYQFTAAAQSVSTKYDIAFVLRGYDGSCYYCDSTDFDAKAKEVVRYLNKLSFGKIATYRIFYNGIDSRSVTNLQSAQDIKTLQAALNGWPGSEWDWLRNRTDFWLVVPDNYRQIVANAIEWMKTTKLDLSSWGKQTTEGVAHYNAVQNNIGRMGPSASADYLKGLKMPRDYNPADFKYTEVILSSMSKATIVGAGAQNTLMSFGIVDADSVPYNSFYDRATYVFYSPRDLQRTSSNVYTSIHEGVHACGMGTHDVDDQERNLSVMSSFGAIETYSMLPAWNRYFWTKWLPISTITNDSLAVADLKDKGTASHANLKYIHELVKGDSLGRGGTYREKYDGKWYTYTVDNWGTLRFTSSFKNENVQAPLNAVLDVPVVKSLGDTVSFYIVHDGSSNGQVTYKWFKDDVQLEAGAKYTFSNRELKINGVTKADEGFYTCEVTNSFGSLSSQKLKMHVPFGCVNPPPPTVANISICQGTTAASLTATAASGNTLRWYGTNATGGTASTTAPTPATTQVGTTNYYVSQVNANGCESDRAVITVTINAKPALPAVSNVSVCIGAAATPLTATVASGNTLRWYGTNATGGTASATAPTPATGQTGSTSYYVSQVNANGCESDRAVLVFTVNPKPSKPSISWNGNDLSVPNDNASYLWLLNNNPVQGATANTHKPLNAGSYRVLVTNTQGCSDTSDAFNLVVTASPVVQSNTNKIAIFPNPASTSITIDLGKMPTGAIYIQLLSNQGSEIIHWVMRQRQQSFSIEGFQSGIYWIKMIDGKSITTQKIVLQTP